MTSEVKRLRALLGEAQSMIYTLAGDPAFKAMRAEGGLLRRIDEALIPMETPMATDPTNEQHLRSIRAKAYAVFRKADVQISKQSSSRFKFYSPGVLIQFHHGRVTVEVPSYPPRNTNVRAIAALRAAGWEVNDDGGIVALPGAPNAC